MQDLSKVLMVYIVYPVTCAEHLHYLVLKSRELCLWDTDDGICIETSLIPGTHLNLLVRICFVFFFLYFLTESYIMSFSLVFNIICYAAFCFSHSMSALATARSGGLSAMEAMLICMFLVPCHWR